jgi:alkylation response protein AidB-like acyl-CoA dehydrogenase
MARMLQNVKEIEAAREDLRKPSFMTQLFAGEPDFSLLMPFPSQPEADRTAGDAYIVRIERFLRESVDPREIERTGTIPRAVLDGLAKLGAFGMTIPPEYGGLGLSQTNYDRVLTLVASHCNILALLLSVHQSIGVPRPLLLFGTDEQKRKWLPRLAGGAISAFALTEPQIGSDPASMKTSAVLSDDGTHYVVNGEKLWCTNGPIAEIVILMAKVEGKVTAFVVEMDSPGIELRHRCEFMGCRGIENGWITLKDVRVPVENVIGGTGKGLRVALTTLNYGRVSVAAICLGMAQQMYLPTVAWARERRAFGKPIGEHELNAQKLARLAADIFAMEALVHLAAGMVDRGQADFRVEAAIAKLVCSERLWDVVDTAMQILGGRGYETADSLEARGERPVPVEQIFRDARLYLIGEGASEVLKLFIAREVWDAHLKRAAPLFAGAIGDDSLMGRGRHYARLANTAGKLGAFYARWYAERLRPDGELGPAIESVRDSALRRQLHYVKSTSRRLARVILQQMARYTTGLEERQGIVARLADIGIDLFTMSAVCSYAEKVPGGSRLALQVCADARDRIEELFRSLRSNRDANTTALGRSVLAGNFDWLTEGSITQHD